MSLRSRLAFFAVLFALLFFLLLWVRRICSFGAPFTLLFSTWITLPPGVRDREDDLCELLLPEDLLEDREDRDEDFEL